MRGSLTRRKENVEKNGLGVRCIVHRESVVSGAGLCSALPKKWSAKTVGGTYLRPGESKPRPPSLVNRRSLISTLSTLNSASVPKLATCTMPSSCAFHHPHSDLCLLRLLIAVPHASISSRLLTNPEVPDLASRRHWHPHSHPQPRRILTCSRTASLNSSTTRPAAYLSIIAPLQLLGSTHSSYHVVVFRHIIFKVTSSRRLTLYQHYALRFLIYLHLPASAALGEVATGLHTTIHPTLHSHNIILRFLQRKVFAVILLLVPTALILPRRTKTSLLTCL